MHGLAITSPPAVEPLTLTEAKAHLRVSGTDDDATVLSYLAASRIRFERETGRQLITADYTFRLDRFPRGMAAIRLPKPPLQEVAEIRYIDPAGDEQTLIEGTDYIVDIDREPGEIRLAYDMTWPSTRLQPNAVEIDFTCGHGDAETDINELIRGAIRLMLGQFFEYREDLIAGTIIAQIPRGAAAIIASYVVDDQVDYDVDE
jgi:uncharacterized phiE125 gp8 family phage protein